MVSSIDSSSSCDLLNYIESTDKKSVLSTDGFKSIQNSIIQNNSQLQNTDSAVEINPQALKGMTLRETFIANSSTKEEFFSALAFTNVDSIDDFTESCNVANTLGKDYLGSNDYDSLYQDYMGYRECDTQEDLEALSSVFPQCITKTDLMNTASMDMAQTSFGIENATRTRNDCRTGLTIDNNLFNNILSSASVENLANFVNTCNSSQEGSFATQVSNLQSFLSSVSSQEGIDPEIKNGISGYAQKVISSADDITAYAIKGEENRGGDTSSVMSSEAYRALLISQYQS